MMSLRGDRPSHAYSKSLGGPFQALLLHVDKQAQCGGYSPTGAAFCEGELTDSGPQAYRLSPYEGSV
jgi:hypothetical protein